MILAATVSGEPTKSAPRGLHSASNWAMRLSQMACFSPSLAAFQVSQNHKEGRTPLFNASVNGFYDIVQILLANHCLIVNDYVSL